ncbi:hypothetical protein JQS43_20640 [Natronosporangium hydrolyticum]|uniref:Uncharacterized protein n=1 Tax=Natronosporangium hydrolyticum TaxID=2811111 RepID=A0A895YEU7_9ACTN|nr:hypothetical protein [Natronosporangium hydrolyticum]QSB13929.1 hypothetical protein JQS43_20640 [Natronosporangium hydrolyticum]
MPVTGASEHPQVVVYPRTWWQTPGGRRAGWRRGLAGAVTVLVLAVAVLLWLERPPTNGAGGAGETAVAGYPERADIKFGWRRRLPDAPGPAAGTIQAGGSVSAVSDGGARWRLPDQPGFGRTAKLSPDGRYLLQYYRGALEIRDLIDGGRSSFPDVDVRWMTDPFWSPDSSRVLVPTAEDDPVVVLGVDGSQSELTGPGVVAGWAGRASVVWLAGSGDPARGRTTVVAAKVVSLAGETLRTVELQPESPWRVSASDLLETPLDSTVSVAPDGAQLAIIERGGSEDELRRFSLRDGMQLAAPVMVSRALSCPISWAGSAPVVHTYERESGRASVVRVVDDRVERLIVFAPRLEVRCSVWATEALTGQAHSAVFGTNEAWWTWWRSHLTSATGIGLLGSLLVGVWRWLRKRARSWQERSIRKPGPNTETSAG